MEEETPDPENNDSDDQLRNGGTLTDVFGLGALAKSPASKEIAKSIAKLTGLVVDPARTLLMGLAKTKIDANRIRSIAKAQAEARQIEVSADELVQRMKERVVANEIRRQINIETATTGAIEFANKAATDGKSRAIDDDWMTSWIEGASEVSADEVRQLWSKVLAAESLASSNHVTKASLPLLQLLDANLARTLTDYIKFRVHFGAYPAHPKMAPQTEPRRQLAMLKEIGFIGDGIQDYFEFDEFKLRLGGRHGNTIGMIHSTLDLTQRGYEICNAVFDQKDLEKELPEKAVILGHYRQILTGALEEGPIPITLEFSSATEPVILVVLNRATTPSIQIDTQAIELAFKESELSLSDVSRDLLFWLAKSGNIVEIAPANRT